MLCSSAIRALVKLAFGSERFNYRNTNLPIGRGWYAAVVGTVATVVGGISTPKKIHIPLTTCFAEDGSLCTVYALDFVLVLCCCYLRPWTGEPY